jgi:hypothetical protein
MADDATVKSEQLSNNLELVGTDEQQADLSAKPTNINTPVNSANCKVNGMESQKENSMENTNTQKAASREQKQSSSEKLSPSSDSNHDNHNDKDPTPEDALLGNKKANGIHDIVVTMDTLPNNNKQSGSCPVCCGGVLRCLRRNEYLVLILGSVTFLLGCIVLAVGVYMMQARGKSSGPVSDVTQSCTCMYWYSI